MANPNPTHKFTAGNSFGGRTPKIKELREFCQSKSLELLEKLAAMLEAPKTPIKVKFDIIKLFLAYGFGNPADSVLDIKEHNDNVDIYNVKKRCLGAAEQEPI